MDALSPPSVGYLMSKKPRLVRVKSEINFEISCLSKLIIVGVSIVTRLTGGGMKLSEESAANCWLKDLVGFNLSIRNKITMIQ